MADHLPVLKHFFQTLTTNIFFHSNYLKIVMKELSEFH